MTTQSCGARGNQCLGCSQNETCSLGACTPVFTPNPVEPLDAGSMNEDSGIVDGGEADAGATADAGTSDAGAFDAGIATSDAGSSTSDAGVVVDGGSSDCAGTLALCATTCRDLSADVENCGACGRVCGSGQVCNQGTCAPLPMDCTLATCGAGYSCDPLTRRCVTGCRLSTDCPMGATCQQGQCQCPSMNHACGQRCVPNQAVISCGNRCTACPQPAANGVAACTAGACTFACTPGFVSAGVSCVDVNECLVDNGGCGSSTTSSCTNTVGGRTCGCVTGYASADGGVCSDVDECATNNGGCSSNATCTNTTGARTCTCQPGWVGDGVTCTRVTCATDNGGCHPNAVCTDTTTWPTCACGAGFEGDGQWCLAASSQKRWRQTVTTSPPQRSGAAMAYDPVRRRTVLFGGRLAQSSQFVNETWEFDGSTWTQRTLAGTLPPPRTMASMAFDPLRGVLVMVGGADGRDVNAGTQFSPGFFSDVWEYNGSTWVQVGGLPGNRADGSLVFDSARGKLVLAGGLTRAWGGFLTERPAQQLFERTGTTWATNATSVPLNQGFLREHLSFAADPVRSVVVMAGGTDETWTFNGTTWVEVGTARPASVRERPQMTWDAQRQRVVLFGGRDPAIALPSTETREFDGVVWAPQASVPTAISGATIAYDSGRNRVVLLGNSTNAQTSLTDVQTWELGVFRAMPSSQYVQSTIVASCAALTSPVTLLGPATSPVFGDETTSATVPLPFGFWLFGDPVTHLSVQTNGLAQLHTSASGVGMASTFTSISTALPSSFGPNGFIAALWVDLEPLPTGRVAAQTFGVPGHRVHVIEWRDLVRFTTTIAVTFQVKLFEDTGAVEVHWCTVPPLSRTPVVALENLTGTAASQFVGSAMTGGGVRFQP